MTEPLAKQPLQVAEAEDRPGDDFDVGSFVEQALLGSVSAADKFLLLKNHFVPRNDFVFLVNAGQRVFQRSWFSGRPWLVYSRVDNGGYCLPCVLFAASRRPGGQAPGVLVGKPTSNFKKALETLDKLVSRSYHVYAVAMTDNFLKIYSGEQRNARQQADSGLAARVAENRPKLKSIMETVLLC